MMTKRSFDNHITTIISEHARHCDDVVRELRADLAAALGKIGPGREVRHTVLRELRADLSATIGKINRELATARRLRSGGKKRP